MATGLSPKNISPKKLVPFLEILKQAGRIVWQNRFMLWFGLLMALGSPGSFNISRDTNEFGPQGETIKNFLAAHWQIVAVIAILFFFVGIFLLLVSLIAKAGLIRSVNLVSRSKKTNFREGWRSGKKYLGKLFGLLLLFTLAILIIIIVLAIPVVFLIVSKFWIGAILVGIIAVAILIPLLFVFALTKTFAEFYIVLSNLHVWTAIETGYDLLLKNVGNSIAFALLLVALSIVAGIVLLPIAGLALVILVPTGFVFYYLNGVAFAIFLFFAVLLFLAAILFVSSIFQTYKTAAWTLFFHEIAKVEKPETEAVVEEEIEKSIAGSPEKVI